jgi:ArsR family transcriptional regulator
MKSAVKRKVPRRSAGAVLPVHGQGSPAEASALVEAFRALGDSTRLKILELLRKRGGSCCDLVSPDEPGLCACDVEQAVGLSQAAVSHHLGVLRRAGLIVAEKRGRWMYYRRDESALAGLAREAARVV